MKHFSQREGEMDECQDRSGGAVHHPAASAVNRPLFIHSHSLSFTRVGSYVHVLTFTRALTRALTHPPLRSITLLKL